MKTILAPVDFSDATETVIEQAARIASLTQGSVVLLNVTQPPVLATDYGPIIETIVAADVASEKSAQKKLDRLKIGLAARFIASEAIHRRGAPAAEILDEARLRKPDYIVIGSHGHSALFNLLVGSTTHGVLKGAACPVLVVPIRAPAKTRASPRKKTHAKSA